MNGTRSHDQIGFLFELHEYSWFDPDEYGRRHR